MVIPSTRVITIAPADSTVVETPSSATPDADISNKVPTAGVIAGATIGGTVVLVAIGFLIFWCARRDRKRPASLEFFPPPVREPTVPVLLHNPNDRYRDVPVSPVSELSPTTSPAPRYSAMYAPPLPGVAEMQAQQSPVGGSGKCKFFVFFDSTPGMGPSYGGGKKRRKKADLNL